MALWADEYPPALALLRRVLPPGLMRFLQQKRSAPGAARPTSPPAVRALPAPSHHVCARVVRHAQREAIFETARSTMLIAQDSASEQVLASIGYKEGYRYRVCV